MFLSFRQQQNPLISKGVDALYTGNDNTIASAMATYTDAAYAKKVPIYCGADSMVADGGFATVGVNYVQLGKQVADMVEKIANGEKFLIFLTRQFLIMQNM